MAKAVKSAVKVFVITFAVMSGAIAIFGTGGAFTGTLFGVKALEMAGLSAISTLIGGLMSKGVDAVGENFGSKISTRSATNPRQIIYGKARVGGTITHIETSGTDNHKLSMIVSLAGHELESLDEVLINDISVTSTSVGLFQYATNSKFKNTDNDNKFDSNGTLLRYKFIDGSQTTADSSVTANTSLTTSDKFIDVAYVFIEMVFDSEAFGGGIPPMSFVVKGKKVYDPRDSNQTFGTESTYTWSDNPALCVLDYITNTTYGLKATADEINTSTALGSFKVAANTCDIDTNTITTATVNGAVSGTQVTLDISNSITLIDVGQIVTGTGIVGTVKVASRDGNIIKLSSAQTIADGTTLTIKEKSYTANGITNMSADGGGVIEGLLSSCAGKLSYIDGKFVMFAGATVIPDMTITDDNLLAPITVQTRQTSGETFNQVKSVYVDANNNYVATDSPLETTINPATSNTFLSEDTPTGEAQANYKKTLEVQLPFTDTSTMAQRLQRTALLHTRQKTALSVVCNIAYMQLQPFDWVYLTNERLGYTNKVFEVLGTNLEVLEKDGVQVLATRLDLKEIDNSVYSFASSSYTNPLDEGSSVSTGSFSVSAPTGLSVSATLINTGYDLNVQWTNIQNDNIQGTEILYGTTSGTYTGSVITGKGVAKEIINNVKPNTTYYIVARHFSNNNVFSSYTSEVTINTASTGDITAPSTPTSLSATTGKPLSIGLSWTNPSNSDLRDIKIYRSTSSGFTPNDGTNLVRTIAGVPSVSQKVSFGIDDGLVAGTTYYFKVKAVSFFDKESSASSQASGSFTKVEATDIDAIFSGYFHVEGSTTTALTDSAFNTAHGRLPIEDDILIMVNTSASPKVSKAYKYSGTSGSGGSFVEINNFQTGDLVVDGTIAGSKIVANDITADQIATETITANELATDSVIASKINVTNLQAISTDLGSITAGSLNIGSGNFTVSTAGVMTATGSTISGNVTTTTLVVTEDADVIGNLKATSLASNIVKITNLHQEVWNEIDARTATTQNGFYDEFTSAGGVGYIGVEKNFELLGSGDNGYQVNSKDITLRGGSVSFIGSSTTEFTGTALQFTAQYQYKLLPSGNWTNAGSSYTATADVAESGGTYYYEVDADPDATITGLTSGSYYQFRLKISPVVTTNVYRVSPTGAADSNGITVIFEVQQSSTSTGTGAGTVTSVGSGDGLSGGPITGSGSLTVDSTVVRTSGVQTLGGNKTFSDNVVIQGDLDVQGTTTTIDTTNLDVADKNITLNYGTGDTSANANGAGITIQDAVSSTQDATLTWNTTNDSFNFSHNLNFADNVKVQLGTGNDLQIWHGSIDSYIVNETGNLDIINKANDKDISFYSDDGSGGFTEYFRLDGSLGYSRALKDIRFDDNVKATFGSSNDLQIYHDGSNVISASSGNIVIDQNTDDGFITLRADDGSGGIASYFQVDGLNSRNKFFKKAHFPDNVKAQFGDSDDLQIYHNGTDSVIDNLTGDLYITNKADDKDIIFRTDNGAGGFQTYFFLDGSAEQVVFEKSARFTDNDKAIFGTGSDLQIYHNGSASFITENGTGDLRLSANNLLLRSDDAYVQSEDGTVNSARFNSTTGVTLYRANSPKLATTSTGIDITGTVTADGLTVDGNILLNVEGNELQFNTSSTPVNKIYTDDTYTTNGLTISADNGVALKSTNNYLLLDDTGTNEMVLNVDSGERLRVTSTGIDVTGTVTADGLTSSQAAEIFSNAFSGGETPALRLSNTSAGVGTTATLEFIAGSSDTSTNTRKAVIENTSTTSSGSTLNLFTTPDGTNLHKRMMLANNGDISFYEDTGTTAKLFWDASAERLAVGHSSPLATLDIDGDVYIRTGHTLFTDILRPYATTTLTIGQGTNDIAKFTGSIKIGNSTIVDSSRNLTNIGTISSGNITVNNRIIASGDSDTYLQFNDADTFRIVTGDTSRLLINSSGDVQVGTTAPQTNANFNLRRNGANIEFGHNNRTSGYYGTLGAFYNNGQPYLGFSADANDSGNTFNTRGFKGNLIYGNTSGDLIFAQLTNANATGQTPTTRLTINSSGNATFAGTISSGKIEGTTADANGHILKTDSSTASASDVALQIRNSSSDYNLKFQPRLPAGNMHAGVNTDDFGIFTANSKGISIGNNDKSLVVIHPTDGLEFWTNNARRFNIDTSGNIQVNGTTILNQSRNLTNLGSISATDLLTQNNTTITSLGSRDLVTIGSGSRGGALKINDIAGANYYIAAGGYDLTFYKNVSGTSNTAVMQFVGNNASDNTPDVSINHNLSVGNGLSITGDATISGLLELSGGLSADQSGQTISGFSTIRVGDALIGQDVATLTTTSASQTNRILASATTYRTLKVIVQIKSSTNFHATEILLTHNGTTVYMTEYATIFSNNLLATFDADISGGNIRLLIDPNQSVSTEFKFNVSGIEA